MHYIYVLKSLKDNKWYVGCTTDIPKRLKEHTSGKVRSTKYRLPVELIYKEAYADMYEAFRNERFYKTANGKRQLRKKINWEIV